MRGFATIIGSVLEIALIFLKSRHAQYIGPHIFWPLFVLILVLASIWEMYTRPNQGIKIKRKEGQFEINIAGSHFDKEFELHVDSIGEVNLRSSPIKSLSPIFVFFLALMLIIVVAFLGWLFSKQIIQ